MTFASTANRIFFTTITSKTIKSCLLLLALAAAQGSVADQNDPQLPSLFDQLQQSESNAQTREIEAKIWDRWLDSSDQNAQALMTQISYAMSVGEYQLSLRLCNQLVDSNPDFAEAWNKRATLHYLLGNHAQSVADIQQTLLLEPRHFGALSGLGLIFMASGNYEAALEAFNSVLKLSPGSDNARGSVARAKSQIGEEI